MPEETFHQAQIRKINERNARRLGELVEDGAVVITPAPDGVPETAITNVVQDEPVAEAVDVCPTCGRAGDEPCVTASGNVKSDWHSKRGS